MQTQIISTATHAPPWEFLERSWTDTAGLAPGKTHHLYLQLEREVAMSHQIQVGYLKQETAVGAAAVAQEGGDVAAAAGDFEAAGQGELLLLLLRRRRCERPGYELAARNSGCLSGVQEEVCFRNGFAGSSVAARIRVSIDGSTVY
jgi:hypothetical protein